LRDTDDARVWGDADRLQQVFWNVISNAIKFSERGGRVEVRVKRNGARALVEVADNGPGVPRDFLPYMFDRFRQAESGMTRRQGGLGLGLTIVREIMALHGGTASAESPGENQGTTIRLEFAVAEQPRAGSELMTRALRANPPVR
jgi:signal transduction histidine kinase